MRENWRIRRVGREGRTPRDPEQLAGKRVAVALGSEADRAARYWERRIAGMRRIASSTTG